MQFGRLDVRHALRVLTSSSGQPGYRRLHLSISSGLGALFDSRGFMSRSAKRQDEQVWLNLHVSPRTAPSRGQSFAHITIAVWQA